MSQRVKQPHEFVLARNTKDRLNYNNLMDDWILANYAR